MRINNISTRKIYLTISLLLVIASGAATSEPSDNDRKARQVNKAPHHRHTIKHRKNHKNPTLVASISADMIETGESVRLDWRARFSRKGVFLLPDKRWLKKRGSILLSPDKTTTYTLVATNGRGRIKRSFTVSVEDDTYHDVDSPTQPSIANVVSTGTEIQLDWHPASDDHTAASEIIYQIYVSDSALGDIADFRLVGESTGYPEYAFDTGQPETRFYLRVLAMDSAGNKSTYSETVEIETGSTSVVLKPNVTIVDLRGQSYDYQLDLPSSLILNARHDSLDVKKGNVLIVEDRSSEYTLRVLEERVNSAGALVVTVEEISPFELIQEGDIKIRSGSGSRDGSSSLLFNKSAESGRALTAISAENLLLEERSIRYETEIGPLEIEASVNVSPGYEISYLFDGAELKEIGGRVYAEWGASMISNLSAFGATGLSDEFSLDVFDFNRIIQLRVGRIRLPVKLRIDVEVAGVGEINTEGEARFSLATSAEEKIDETIYFRRGEWYNTSLTDTPTYQISPELTAAGSAQGRLEIIPTVHLTINEIFRQTVTGSHGVNIDLEAELIPNLDAVRQVYPQALLQPTKVDVYLSSKCTRDGEILVPFVGEITAYSETGCEEDISLFSLPEVELEEVGEICGEVDVKANISDGVNNAFRLDSAQWFSLEDNSILLGPTSQSEWTLHSVEDVALVFSGHGVLGPSARRYWSTSFSASADVSYYIDILDGEIYVEGETVGAACENLEAHSRGADDGWDYMGVDGSRCYFAYGGVPSEQDFYVRVHSKTACS